MQQVRIGIIGVSGRGDLARYWNNPDEKSVVAAGADTNEEYLRKFKEDYPKAFITTDYRRLLERDDINAIAVTSPDFTHEEYAVAALQARKHVFCEKPLAITIDGCDNILEAWKNSGCHLMVGFNMRYMNMFRKMKQIADSGAIGKIRAVWVRHFVGYGSDFYYHDWHASRQNTTGLLLHKGTHDIDIVHWITGKYGKRVAAFGGLSYFGGDKPNNLTCPECSERETCSEVMNGIRVKCAFRKEIDVEDSNMVIMELDGGIKASYTQCHFTPDYHRNYTFIGTKGSMENHEPSMKIRIKIRDMKSVSDPPEKIYNIEPVEGSHGGADPVICRDFVDMILTGRRPIASPIAGRMSVAVGYCATESLRAGGKVVQVPGLPDRLKDLA